MEESAEAKKLEVIVELIDKMNESLPIENRIKMLIDFAVKKDIETFFGGNFPLSPPVPEEYREDLMEANITNVDSNNLLPYIYRYIDELKKISFATGKASRVDKEGILEEQVEGLKKELAAKTSNRKKNIKFEMYFSILFLIAVGLTIATVHYTTAETKVSIEYNVGEIIGSILGGLGVAAAGFAYASKTLKETDKE